MRYFDSTKSGVLVSRVMNDPEGIRNLIGTGLIQLTGGILSAIAALGVLIHLNWRLTLVTVVFLAIFGAGMSVAFKRLRPIFRERSVITAEVTGRLTETLGGIRLVKVYTAEERERAVFGKGVQRLFANIAKTITGTSLTGTLGFAVVGVIGVIAMYVGGRDVITGAMTLGSLLTFVFSSPWSPHRWCRWQASVRRSPKPLPAWIAFANCATWPPKTRKTNASSPCPPSWDM